MSTFLRKLNGNLLMYTHLPEVLKFSTSAPLDLVRDWQLSCGVDPLQSSCRYGNHEYVHDFTLVLFPLRPGTTFPGLLERVLARHG